MADEPRRSGRSTKGQHKNLEMPDAPAKKGKGKKGKAVKASAEEPTPDAEDQEETIRCICGEYEEEEDVERDMICCDQCLAWQHNDCMGLSFPKGQEPEEYFCEQCKPENHKALLEAIGRGERPWEQVAEQRRREFEEQKASRGKKGKKGRKSRASEPRSDVKGETTTPTPGPTGTSPASRRATSACPPARDDKNGQLGDSQKRKFEEQDASQPDTHPKGKQQKVESPAAASGKKDRKPRGKENAPLRRTSLGAKAAVGLVESPEELSNPGRKNAAGALIKLLKEQFPEAQKAGLAAPEGKPAEEFARQLGILIENTMYVHFDGNLGELYKSQLRAILFNVKKNASLCNRLFSGSLSPESLVQMSSQDMASEELQQKDAEIKRESERQHIIVQEQGPRIRRTHKGEELVEDQNHTAASESVFSAAPRRSVGHPDGSPHSPASPAMQQQPLEAPPARKSQSIDTKTADGESRRRQSQSTLRSPDGHGHDPVFPEVSQHIPEPMPARKAQADAEIDHLLRDDEPDSPPYSPKDYQDEGTVWRGKVVMHPIVEFSASGKFVGGADLDSHGIIPWSQLVPSTLSVAGRIPVQRASDYLCGLRFSSSTDVAVMALNSPRVPSERARFDKLFDYFQQRERYGVIDQHPMESVTDIYIVPVESGASKSPEFMQLLENNAIEDPNPERLFLVVFVVKTRDSHRPSLQPPSHLPSQEPASSASPVTMGSTPHQGQFATPGPHNTSHISPPPPTGGPPAQVPHGQYQPQSHPPQASASPVTGIAAAAQVLGPQAQAPAIQQLISQVPIADVSQLAVVRDIVQRQPEAASDYKMLLQALAQHSTNGHPPQ